MKTQGMVLPCFIFLSFFVQAALYGQPSPPKFTTYGPRDGLSHDSVYEILESSHGFLWIATEDGLNRFDGYTFVTYRHDPDNSLSLAENDINSLAEDAEGHLWIGTWGAGLERFDPRTEAFEHFRNDPQDPHSLQGFRVQTILAAQDGTVWAGTYRYGLNRFDPTTGRFEHFQHDPEDAGSLPHNHIWSVAENQEGELWVGTNRGMSRFDESIGGFENFFHRADDPNSISHDRVRSIYFDHQGGLWICTERGLDYRDPETGRISRRLTREGSPAGQNLQTYKDVAQGPDGRLWIATRNRGLLVIDPSTDAPPQAFQHDPRDPVGLSNNDVRDLMVDSADNLWIGTRGGGLNRIDLKPLKFDTYHADPTNGLLSHERVWAVSEGSDGDIWVGTSRGLDRIRPAQGQDPASVQAFAHRPEEPTSLMPGTVRALLHDSQDRIWVGTENGLSVFDPTSGSFTHYRHDAGDPNSLSHDEILCLFEDSSGNMWIGTDGGGLDRRDRWSGRFSHLVHDPTDPESLSFNRVRVLLEDHDGTLWVGTDGAGLDRLDPGRSSFVHFRHDPEDTRSLSNDNVISLHRDPQSRLWVGTHSGLNLLQPEDGSFTVYRETLPSAFIYGILQGYDHHLWLTTNQGILRFDPETESVVSYGLDDGLLSLSFNEGAYHRSESGVLYAGGIRGLVTFDPSRLVANPHRPPIYFTSIRNYSNPAIDLQGHAWQIGALELKTGSTFLALEVAALDFTAPDQNLYTYRIEGLDEDWRPLEGREITLSNLAAGTYKLRVKGSNNDAVWSEQDATLELNIIAPIWHSNLFRWTAAFISVILLWLLHGALTARHFRRIRSLENAVASRSRKLRDRDKLLSAVRRDSRRFSFLLSHDFRSPMVNLQGFASQLGDAIDHLRDALQPHLRDLPKSSHERARRAFDETIPEALGFVTKSTHRLYEMTGSIQRLSQVSNLLPNLESVDLRALVLEKIQEIELEDSEADGSDLRDAQVEIHLDGPDAPIPAISDPRFVRKILHELLINSIENAEPSRPGRVEIRCSRSRQKVRIHVSDNGIGIEAEHQDRIFDALFQRRSPPEPSRGMGLTIASALAQQLDGWIDCQSEPGEGTEMILVLPQYSPGPEKTE